MKEAFTISRAQLSSGGAAALRDEVIRRTGSQEQAASVLRTLGRLGSERSISHFEITPVVPRRVAEGGPDVLWNVRAVRQ